MIEFSLKRFFVSAFIIFFLSHNIFAVCTGGNSAGSINITASWQTISVSSFSYYSFNASSEGQGIVFSFCQGGGSNLINTQLEIHDEFGNYIGFYNNNTCDDGSEIIFIAPYAGEFRVAVYEFNCSSNVTSAGTLAYREYILPNEQDCLGAITVCNETYNQNDSYFGYGTILDYTSSSTCPGLCVESEDNSVWYTFQVQEDGVLNFAVTPNDNSSDYDWALFDLTNHNCDVLQSISSYTNLIVSCNAAYDYGPTGANNLTPNTGSDCQGPSSFGDAEINNPPINVSAGEIYYLNIQNWSATSGGYVLDFSQSSATIIDNSNPTVELIETPDCAENSFTVLFSENVECSSVNYNDFSITGPGGPYTIEWVLGNNCAAGSTMEREFVVSFYPPINANGTFTIDYQGNAHDFCGNLSESNTWSFTSDSDAEVTLVSAVATTNQTICLGESIDNISYSTIGILDVDFLNFPPGLNTNFNASTGSITITGTPTAIGLYNFSIECEDNCGLHYETGSINVLETTNVSFDKQFYCVGETPEPLPNTTTNGIIGTWNPSSINTSNPGTFSYTFTPNSGQCANVATLEVEVTNSMQANFNQIGPLCLNQNPPSLPTTSLNGINGFWQPSVITTNEAGLFSYVFTPTDDGCFINTTMQIQVTTNPEPVITIVDSVRCFGGEALINVSGSYGTSPYQGTGSFTVPAGMHQYTITDANSCVGSASVVITQPPSLTSSVESVQDQICNTNGSASLVASGGTPPYSFFWPANANEVENSSANSLEEGTYQVTVLDSKNCQTIQELIINYDPGDITVDIDIVSHVSCYSNNDAEIFVSINNADAPFSVIAENVNHTSNTNQFFINDLFAKEYYFRVQDKFGCFQNVWLEINQPEPIEATSTSEDPTCIDAQDGYIEVIVEGGTEPYTYFLNGLGYTTSTIDNLVDGVYNVLIIDDNECEHNLEEIILNANPIECLIIPDAFTPNEDGINDYFIIGNIELYPDAIINIFNRWGQPMYSARGNGEPWDGKFGDKKVPAGTYIYTILLQDRKKTFSGTVTIMY